MQKTKTFSEIAAETINLYPSYVDEATQASIYDWFQYRRVTDNARFPVYFGRILARDYSRYRQLLRIEAGKQGDTGTLTEFDWLVTDYLERYEKRDRESEHTGSTSGSTSGTSSDTTTVTAGSTIESSTSSETALDYGQEVTNAGTSSDTSSSTDKSESSTMNEVRAGTLTRTQPMSAEYTDAAGDYSDDDIKHYNHSRGYINETQKGYNVGKKHANASDPSSDDWSGDTADSYIVGLEANFPRLGIKNPSTAADSLTSTGTISEGKDQGSSTSSGETSSETQYGGTDTTTVESGTTTTKDDTSRTVGSGTTSGTSSETVTGSDSGTDTSQIQHTGRGGEIAEILKRAQDYIKTSSAFDWLRGQLEPCFIANLDY